MNTKMGLVGRKVGMTQLFEADGTVVPVTVLEAGPNIVLQVKTKKTKDGYEAVQLGFAGQRESLVTKAEAGHAKAAGVEGAAPREVREIRVADASKFERGQTIAIGEVFQSGQMIDVIGTSKGRGFSGVMKRHHFAGFERTHGCHEYFRHGGSIGTRLTPGMTLKGKKMPGQQGNEQVTVQNIKVVKIDAERNLLFVRGGVPGPNGAFVTIRQAVRNQG